MRVVAVAMVALVVAGPVRPAGGDPAAGARARELYQAGQERFQAGRYAEAIDAFERGYTLDPRPEFLLNLAQSYRALGRRAEAISYFERFIAAAPDHELRPAAERTLTDLRREEESERRSAPATPPPPTPPPAGRAPAPPRRLSLVSTEREPARRAETAPRGSSRVWLWAAVGAALLAGGGVALYLGTRGGDDADVIDTVRLPDP